MAETLEAVVRANIAQFKRQMDEMTRTVRQVGQRVGVDFDAADRSVKKLTQDARQATDSLTGMSKASSAGATAMRALGAAMTAMGVTLFVREIVQASNQMIALTNAFKVITGSAQGSQQALSFVRQEANRLGLDFAKSAQAFQGLAAAARGTALEGKGAQEVFTAVAEASRVLGLSSDTTQGALLALQQMMSKGTVQAEELRGQLGERVPGAFQIAARAMNVTTQELGKMLEQGQVMAADFLPKFARQLRQEFAGGVQEAGRTFAAETTRMGNAWFELMRSMGDMITQSPAVRQAIRDIATELQTLAETIQQNRGLFEGFFTFLADSISGSSRLIRDALRAINPPAQIQELKDLTRQISETEKEISELQNLLASPTRQFILRQFFLPGFAPDWEKDLAQAIQKLEQLQAARARLARSMIGTPSVPEEVFGPAAEWRKYQTWAATSEEAMAKLAELRKKHGADAKDQAEEIIRLLDAEAKGREKVRKEIEKQRQEEERLARDTISLMRDRIAAQERANEARLDDEHRTMDRFLAIQRRGWEEAERIEEETRREQKRLSEETARVMKDGAEESAKAYERFGERVQDTLEGVFRNILDGSFNLFGTLKNAFLDMLAQMAAAAARPIVVNILGQLGGAIGIPGLQGAVGQAGGLMGSGGMLGPLGGLIGKAGGLLNIPIFTMPGTGIPSPIPGVSGLMGAQTMTLGNVLGGVGAGIGGGMLMSNILGQFGVGGLANRIPSGAVGGAIAGTMIAPGIGTAIGAIVGALGGWISGLFRTKPPELEIFETEAPKIVFDNLLQQLIMTQPMATYERGRGLSEEQRLAFGQAMNQATDLLFGNLLQAMQQFTPEMQARFADPLNIMAREFAEAIEGTRFEGKNVAEKLQQFMAETMPRMFDDIFGPFQRGAAILAQTTQGFEQAMIAIRDQQRQVLSLISGTRTGLLEALMTPAQIFEKRRATLQDLLLQFDVATGSQQISMVPRITQLIQEIFGLAQQPDVMGQDRGLLVRLQTEFLGVLQELEDVTGKSFTERLDTAQQQLDVLNEQYQTLQSLESLTETQLTEANRTLAGILQFLQQNTVPFVGNFQTGGLVTQTGMAMVHAGERVTPSYNNTVQITIERGAITGGGNMDESRLAETLYHTIATRLDQDARTGRVNFVRQRR